MTFAAADPRAALRRAVADVLTARGRSDLAEIVAAAEIEVSAATEAWSMGTRAVVAQRFALLLEPRAFVRLHGDAEATGVLRDAFAAVVRSFDTELAELALFVRIEGGASRASWGRAYRDAPPPQPIEPSPSAVKDAMTKLAEAYRRREARDVLERTELEVGPIGEPSSGLRRWIVRLPARDLVRLDRDASLASQLESMLRAAATGPTVQVGDVVFAVRL